MADKKENNTKPSLLKKVQFAIGLGILTGVFPSTVKEEERSYNSNSSNYYPGKYGENKSIIGDDNKIQALDPWLEITSEGRKIVHTCLPYGKSIGFGKRKLGLNPGSSYIPLTREEADELRDNFLKYETE